MSYPQLLALQVREAAAACTRLRVDVLGRLVVLSRVTQAARAELLQLGRCAG